jgi:integrase
LLSGAFKKAIKKWKWLSHNPCVDADPPSASAPDPTPPTPAQAAAILNAAWAKDEDWGTLTWLAMTTGARRGELCALRWTDLELETAGEEAISIRRGISKTDDRNRRATQQRWREGPTKTHQHRRLALDDKTVDVLRDYRDRCTEHTQADGTTMADDAYVFSAVPDQPRSRYPDSVSTRYDRLATKLGIKTTIHKLRHYSATELIRAGAAASVRGSTSTTRNSRRAARRRCTGLPRLTACARTWCSDPWVR